MFMQIDIQPQDQDYLPFLWTEDDDEKSFKYNELFLGATCSLSCAILLLQRCANDHTQEHPKAHTSIMQQFYIDDFMQTYPSREEARRSAQEIKTVLQTGELNLTTILSNKPTTLENVPEEDKAETKTQKNPGSDVGSKDWKVDDRKTKASLHKTTADSEKIAINGCLSLRSGWTNFIFCRQNYMHSSSTNH